MAMPKLDAFQVIGDPSRRKMLMLLSADNMTINSLADHFDMSRPAVSKHIKILTECELINSKQSGREIYYHFNPQKMKEVSDWLEPFREMWEDKFSQLDQILNKSKKKKHGNQ